MATTAITASGRLRYLPLTIIGVLLGVGLLLATIAPGHADKGVYDVTIGQGQDMFQIGSEQLDCTRTGADAVCVTQVNGAPLTMRLRYSPDSGTSTCAAEHGDRTVLCVSWRDYGPASHRVTITDQLGVTGDALEQARADLPWWRGTGDGIWLFGGMALAALLALGAGATAYRLAGSSRPAPRLWLISSTALLGIGAPAIGILALSADTPNLLIMLSPMTLVSTVLLVWWQATLLDAASGPRWRQTLAAGGATLFYAFVVMMTFILVGGFVD